MESAARTSESWLYLRCLCSLPDLLIRRTTMGVYRA
jgi:hypothetical protein